jgi:hypothetical protein
MSDLDLGDDEDDPFPRSTLNSPEPKTGAPPSPCSGEDTAIELDWELTSDSGWASEYKSPINKGAGLLH